MKQQLLIYYHHKLLDLTVTYLVVCFLWWGMDSWIDLLITSIHHLELHFTDHWHTETSDFILLQSPLAASWIYWVRFFSFLHSGPLVTAAHAELLSTDNSTNWVPGWQPFHNNLLVFSSQAHFQLQCNWTLSFTNQLVTSLNSNYSFQLQNLTDLITFSHEPHRNPYFHCYSPTIPGPLHAYLLPWELIYWAVA
jgi:hypothetical protein